MMIFDFRLLFRDYKDDIKDLRNFGAQMVAFLEKESQKGFAPIIILLTLVIIGGAIGGVVYFGNKARQPTLTLPKPTSSQQGNFLPTNQPQVSVAPADQTVNWKTYVQNTYHISFSYPSSWLGPEEYPKDNPTYISIGTFKPHKWGEDRSFDVPTKDSYFVTIQIIESKDADPWMAEINEAFNLKLNQSFNSHGRRTTKIQDMKIAGKKASEFIIDNDPNGATEGGYAREVIIMYPNFVILIKGEPTIISSLSSTDVDTKARIIDQQYKATFDQILSTFHITQ